MKTCKFSALLVFKLKFRLVTGSRDCTLRVWNIKTGALLQILYAHLAAVRCVQYDGKRIVSGSYDYKIAVFEASDTYCRKHLLTGHTDRVYSLLASRNFILFYDFFSWTALVTW
jgi:WD40 repeat protein